MITINFLPWREQLRYKRRRWFIVLCLFSCLLSITVILSIYIHLHHKVILPIKRKVKQTPDLSVQKFVRKYKLSGIILQDQKRWALILTPNGKVIMVKSGDLINEKSAQVKQITSTEISILINNKLLWLKIKDKK